MYEPSRIDLLEVDPQTGFKTVTVAESWGDAGEEFSMRSWLLDVDQDGDKDIIRRTCQTYQEPGVDSAALSVTQDVLELIRWESNGFALPTTGVAPELRSRFASGAESCSA
jgi:hypothetical protein